MTEYEIFRSMNLVCLIIKDAHQVLPRNCIFEVYHHYGAEKFCETGTVFIKVVNREYCKSYAVILPKQNYPAHYHKIKMETFFVLYGDLTVVKEGITYNLLPGDMLDVERLEEHAFSSEKGCVFEEISTTYMRNDSIYTDSNVYDNYDNRKTVISLNKWKEIYKNETGEEFFC